MSNNSFPDFIGQERWQRYFSQVLCERRWSHAYLFSGSRHLGKRTFVGHFIRALLCQRPNKGVVACGECAPCLAWRGEYHLDALRLTMSAEASSIGVKEVRDFVAALQQTPLETNKRVAIIEDLDRVTIEGLNVLLKTLEEPPSKVTLLLITESAASLPATVLSRLQHCVFSPVPKTILAEALIARGASHSLAVELAALSTGRPGLALRWLEHPEELKSYQAVSRQLLDLCAGSLTDRFTYVENMARSEEMPPSATRDLLAHWHLLLRDFLFLTMNEPRLITHAFLRPRLDEIAREASSERWLDRYRALELLDHNIGRNANRRLAFNNFFLTL